MFIFLSIKHSKCQRYSLQWIRFNIDLPSNVVPMISGRRKALYSECPRCFLLLLLPFLVHSPFHVLVEPTENRKYIRKYPSILNCIINITLRNLYYAQFYMVYIFNKETKYIIETSTNAWKKHDHSIHDISYDSGRIIFYVYFDTLNKISHLSKIYHHQTTT